MDIVKAEVGDNVVVDRRDIDYIVSSLLHQIHHLHFEPMNKTTIKLRKKESPPMYYSVSLPMVVWVVRFTQVAIPLIPNGEWLTIRAT